MAYSRKDVEKTKQNVKKFVRYQEGAEKYSIHCLLHPTFQLAFRDDIIRKNPTDGVLAEVKKPLGKLLELATH